jgi:hypothetical protein
MIHFLNAPGQKTALMACVFSLLTVGGARPIFGDEYDDFAIAKNAFDAGEYQEAVKRFDVLLKRGLQNPSLVIESHKLIGISYLFIGNQELAESHFTKLLTLAPNFTLDPLLYPIEVIDFLTKIKQENQKRLEALAKAKALEEAARKAEEAARQKAETEKLKRNIYIEREVHKGSLLMAALPFGAGQFQNGEKIKGYLFLSGELILTAASITFFFLHAGLRDDAEAPVETPAQRENLELREKVYRIGNHVSLGALGAVTAAGIIDALLRFKKETASWKRVKEKDVPEELRPKPGSGAHLSVTLQTGNNLFGVSLGGRF